MQLFRLKACKWELLTVVTVETQQINKFCSVLMAIGDSYKKLKLNKTGPYQSFRFPTFLFFLRYSIWIHFLFSRVPGKCRAGGKPKSMVGTACSEMNSKNISKCTEIHCVIVSCRQILLRELSLSVTTNLWLQMVNQRALSTMGMLYTRLLSRSKLYISLTNLFLKQNLRSNRFSG